jgi:hypothetical protein
MESIVNSIAKGSAEIDLVAATTGVICASAMNEEIELDRANAREFNSSGSLSSLLRHGRIGGR